MTNLRHSEGKTQTGSLDLIQNSLVDIIKSFSNNNDPNLKVIVKKKQPAYSFLRFHLDYRRCYFRQGVEELEQEY